MPGLLLPSLASLVQRSRLGAMKGVAHAAFQAAQNRSSQAGTPTATNNRSQGTTAALGNEFSCSQVRKAVAENKWQLRNPGFDYPAKNLSHRSMHSMSLNGQENCLVFWLPSHLSAASVTPPGQLEIFICHLESFRSQTFKY